LRQVGRGQREQRQDITQLCGHCASGVLAVGPDGAVWPCVFSRWLPVGNVREKALSEILNGKELKSTRKTLTRSFDSRPHGPASYCFPECSPLACSPGMCSPFACSPGQCLPGRCNPDRRCHPDPCLPERPNPCGPTPCRPNSRLA
jgi:hypothetical protein